MKRLTIAVAGCGIAGLASAILFARAGHSVLIVDRMAAPGPVGSGLVLQPVGLAVLRRLGLEADIRELGQRIDRLFGKALPSGRVVLDVRYGALGSEVHGLAVHRAALFHVLYETACRLPIAFDMGRDLAEVERGTDGRPLLVARDGRSLGHVDLVVDALGARSVIAADARRNANGRDLPFGALWGTVPWPDGTGFDAHALEQRYERAHTMIGVLPIGRKPGEARHLATFFWSLRPDRFEAWHNAGLGAWKERVRAVWPQTATLVDSFSRADELVLARYGHHTLPVAAAARVAHVGDSAHATSPQLGQGANMALVDAYALSVALDRASTIDAALESYRRMRGFHVRLYQAASFAFTPFYQSEGAVLPWIRDRIAAPLSRLPPAQRLLARMVSGELLWSLDRMERYAASM